jgi:hypothetical protein
MLRYHVTVTSALQAVARLARLSPMVAVIEVPVSKAQQVAERQAKRYPAILATHTTRTALRKAGFPAVQLVVMPPTGDTVTMYLMCNETPTGSREMWRDALDSQQPLTWRNYSLTRTAKGGVTWRLSEQVRDQYRKRIARLITGRGGKPAAGEQPYQLPSHVAHQQVLNLAAHMMRYPGLSGVRGDVFQLAQYSTKVWKSTHPKESYPAWPLLPYTPYLQPRTLPLEDIAQHPQENPDHDQDQDEETASE